MQNRAYLCPDLADVILYMMLVVESFSGNAQLGWADRISAVMKQKVNALLDKWEDPRQALDYSYIEQIEILNKLGRISSKLSPREDAWNAEAETAR